MWLALAFIVVALLGFLVGAIAMMISMAAIIPPFGPFK